jgi:PAS domain S-box-containing protein
MTGAAARLAEPGNEYCVIVAGSKERTFGEGAAALAGRGAREPAVTLYGRLSIQRRLLLFTAVFIVPCSILLGYAIWSMGSVADASVRRGMLYSAQTIAAAVDAELRRYVALAQVLARSPALLADDLEAFDVEARRASVALGDAWIIVADTDGKVLLNTAAPPSSPLGERTAEGLASQRRALDTGSPSVSDIFIGSNSRQWIATVDLPVSADGRQARVLAVSLPALIFTRLLNQQQLPAEWLVGIIDQTGRYVARVPKNATETGQLASKGWRATIGVDGLSEFPSIEGDHVINANARSVLSGWTIGVGVKKGSLQSAISSTVRTLSFATIGLMGLMLVLGGSIALSIARPLAKIGRAGAPLDVSTKPTSDPPEIRQLQSRLLQAEEARSRSDRALRDNLMLLAEARDVWSRVADQLKLAARAGRLGTFVWDIPNDTNTWSEEIEDLYGLKPGTFGGTYAAWSALVHPDDLPEAEKQAKLSLQTGELHAEWRILLPDGSVRWLEARGRIIRDQQGSPRQMIGVNIDVTAAKAAEQQKELLLGELAHRVKNTLAVVQSIARQTLPKANAGVEVFLNRLYALASVHNSLTRNDWRGARLSELLNDQITPFVGTLASQFHYDGPDVFLPVEASTQIALVIHELACNASKHGSLQSATGMISLAVRSDRP